MNLSLSMSGLSRKTLSSRYKVVQERLSKGAGRRKRIRFPNARRPSSEDAARISAFRSRVFGAQPCQLGIEYAPAFQGEESWNRSKGASQGILSSPRRNSWKKIQARE